MTVRIEYGNGDYTIVLDHIIPGPRRDPVEADYSWLEAWTMTEKELPDDLTATPDDDADAEVKNDPVPEDDPETAPEDPQ